MSADTTTYELEHQHITAGTVTDPIDGTTFELEDGRVELENAASVEILLDKSDQYTAVDGAPSESAIEAARREAFGEWANSEIVFDFADSQNRVPGSRDFAASEGFDPVNDRAYNDTRLNIYRTYEQLLEAGLEHEAEYLRQLASTVAQESFRDYLRDEGIVDG